MTKKKSTLTIDEDLTAIINKLALNLKDEDLPLSFALSEVIKQMTTSGSRPRTISDYELQVNHFAGITEIDSLSQITTASIYDWLASMSVSDQTKLTRLKCLKAFLGKCYNNGWLKKKFWVEVKVKVDSPVKVGAEEGDIRRLLSTLDLTDFVQLRDAVAILTLFQTGVRVNTLANIKESHVNLEENLLRLDGSILKNHQRITLPFDKTLSRLLSVLIKQNKLIRDERGQSNNYLFITQYGGHIVTGQTNNGIQKRLFKYSRQHGLENINPQAIRRGFAKRLYNKSNGDIALVSKALGHSNIEVTTRYLYLSTEEVAENLRKYL